MYAVVLLVVVAILSLLITRVATIALGVTGMSQQAAHFQARSALSGVGYTTGEAETVVHPVRRRVVMALMLAGNIGLVTAVAGLLAGFLDAGGRQATVRAGLLVAGLTAVYLLARSPAVDRRLSRVIAAALGRFTGLVDARAYASLLHLSGGYAIRELLVDADQWMAERSLRDCALRDEGATVLGITRVDGAYVGAPGGDTTVHAGDTLVIYGHRDVLDELARRPPAPPARTVTAARWSTIATPSNTSANTTPSALVPDGSPTAKGGTTMQAQDLMTPDPACCRGKDTARQATQMMIDHDCGCVPIIDEQRHVEGVVTDRDLALRGLAAGKGPDTPLREVLSSPAVCCTPKADTETLAAMMGDNQIRRIPVIDDGGRLLGIVAQADLATYADQVGVDEVGATVAEVSEETDSPSTVNQTAG